MMKYAFKIWRFGFWIDLKEHPSSKKYGTFKRVRNSSITLQKPVLKLDFKG